MNQKEIDRLWEGHSDGPLYDISHTKKQPAFRYMRKHDFTAALQEATAQARREAMDEAAAEAERMGPLTEEVYGFGSECISTADDIAAAIRALAAQPQEGGK